MMSIEDEQVIREGFYKEGMEKGKTEANLENARKMKSMGYATEDISKITGLTPEEIKTI